MVEYLLALYKQINGGTFTLLYKNKLMVKHLLALYKQINGRTFIFNFSVIMVKQDPNRTPEQPSKPGMAPGGVCGANGPLSEPTSPDSVTGNGCYPDTPAGRTAADVQVGW